jgi:hypothetical protein
MGCCNLEKGLALACNVGRVREEMHVSYHFKGYVTWEGRLQQLELFSELRGELGGSLLQLDQVLHPGPGVPLLDLLNARLVVVDEHLHRLRHVVDHSVDAQEGSTLSHGMRTCIFKFSCFTY